MRIPLRNTRLTTDYSHDLVLWRSHWSKAGIGLLLLAFAAAPFALGNYWTTVLIFAGGLDSSEGAVVGGLTIGLIEVMSAAYLVPAFPALGANFHVLVPYFVMIAVLLVRPHGLFGRHEVRRV